MNDAAVDDLVDAQPADLFMVKADMPGRRMNDSGNAAQQRCLAVAVWAENGDDMAVAERQRHPMQNALIP